jgi:hypothetical protein
LYSLSRRDKLILETNLNKKNGDNNMKNNSFKNKRQIKLISRKYSLISVIVVIMLGLTILSGCTEDTEWEVCAEWINNYDEVGKDPLFNRDDCAIGFYNHIIASHPNWNGLFCNGDSDAWEEHWKCSDMGGTNDVDNADIAYFAGHGCADTGLGRGDCFTFGVNANDDWILRATPSYWEPKWGNNDLEWVVLDCCSALAQIYDGPDVYHTLSERWMNSNVMHGLHYILGFRTKAYDVHVRGEIFAEYLTGDRDGVIRNIRDAWKLATQDTEPDWTQGAYIRAYTQDSDTSNDHLHGFGPVSNDPDPNMQFYSYYSWFC